MFTYTKLTVNEQIDFRHLVSTDPLQISLFRVYIYSLALGIEMFPASLQIITTVVNEIFFKIKSSISNEEGVALNN